VACSNNGNGRMVGLDDLVGPFQPCDSMIAGNGQVQLGKETQLHVITMQSITLAVNRMSVEIQGCLFCCCLPSCHLKRFGLTCRCELLHENRVPRNCWSEASANNGASLGLKHVSSWS